LDRDRITASAGSTDFEAEIREAYGGVAQQEYQAALARLKNSDLPMGSRDMIYNIFLVDDDANNNNNDARDDLRHFFPGFDETFKPKTDGRFALPGGATMTVWTTPTNPRHVVIVYQASSSTESTPLQESLRHLMFLRLLRINKEANVGVFSNSHHPPNALKPRQCGFPDPKAYHPQSPSFKTTVESRKILHRSTVDAWEKWATRVINELEAFHQKCPLPIDSEPFMFREEFDSLEKLVSDIIQPLAETVQYHDASKGDGLVDKIRKVTSSNSWSIPQCSPM
jgi:hypothetical protein